MRLWIQIALLVFCVLSCLSGLYFASLLNNETHGARGGAVGVAISFAYLFVSSLNTYKSIEKFDEAAEEISRALKSEASIEQRVQINFDRFNLLKQDIESDAKRQRVSNRFLAASAIVSTLFWGFGDLVARLWIPN